MPATATPPRNGTAGKGRGRAFGSPGAAAAGQSAAARGGEDSATEPGPAARPPVLSTVLLLAAGIGLTAYGVQHDVLLAKIAAPLLTVGAIHGLWRGGFRKLLLLAATVGVLYAAFAGAGVVEPMVRTVAGASSGVVAGLVVAAAAIGLYILAARIVGRMRRRFIANRPGRLAADRFVGLLVGTAEAALVVLCFCWAGVMIRPHAKVVRDHPDTPVGSVQYRVAAAMVQIADESQVEPLGRIVRATNLIERIPPLRTAIDQLNETGHFDLEQIDPAVAARLNQVIPQMSNGQFQNLDQLLEAYRHNQEVQDALRKQLPSSNKHGR